MSELVSQAKIELSFCNNLPLIESHGCGGQVPVWLYIGRIILLGKHVDKSNGEGRGQLVLHKGTFLVKKVYLTSVNNDVLQFLTCMKYEYNW